MRSKKIQIKENTINRDVLVVFNVEDPTRISGKVYPIEVFETGNFSFQGTYKPYHDILNDDCQCLFEFNFRWRGVWDERVYFNAPEYWAGEIKEIDRIWDALQVFLKDEVNELNPETNFDY